MKTNTEAIQFMNALVSNMDIGVITYDMEGFITLINSKAIEYLGIPGRVNNLIDTPVLSHFEIPALNSQIQRLRCFNRIRVI